MDEGVIINKIGLPRKKSVLGLKDYFFCILVLNKKYNT